MKQRVSELERAAADVASRQQEEANRRESVTLQVEALQQELAAERRDREQLRRKLVDTEEELNVSREHLELEKASQAKAQQHVQERLAASLRLVEQAEEKNESLLAEIQELTKARAQDQRTSEEQLTKQQQRHEAACRAERRRCVLRLVGELSSRLEKSAFRLMSAVAPLVHAPLGVSATAAADDVPVDEPVASSVNLNQDASSLLSWDDKNALSRLAHSGVRRSSCSHDSFYEAANGGGGVGDCDGVGDSGGEDNEEGADAREERGGSGNPAAEIQRFEDLLCRWVVEQLVVVRRTCSGQLASSEQHFKAEKQALVTSAHDLGAREKEHINEIADLRSRAAEAVKSEQVTRAALDELRVRHRELAASATASLSSLQGMLGDLRRVHAEATRRLHSAVVGMEDKVEALATEVKHLVRRLADAHRSLARQDLDLNAARGQVHLYHRSSISNREDQSRAGKRALGMMAQTASARTFAAGIKDLLHAERLAMASSCSRIASALGEAANQRREEVALAQQQQHELTERAQAAEAEAVRARQDGAASAEAAARAHTDVKDSMHQVEMLQKEKTELQNQVASERAHLGTMQEHLTAVRETVRKQADELCSGRSDMARQREAQEESRSRIYELTMQHESLAARLEASEQTLTSVKSLLRSKEEEVASLQVRSRVNFSMRIERMHTNFHSTALQRKADHAATELQQVLSAKQQQEVKLQEQEATRRELHEQLVLSRRDCSALGERDLALQGVRQELAESKHQLALVHKDLEIKASEFAQVVAKKARLKQQAEEEKLVAERAWKALEQREAWWQRKLADAMREAERKKEEEVAQLGQKHCRQRDDLEKSVEALQHKITQQSIEAFDSLRQAQARQEELQAIIDERGRDHRTLTPAASGTSLTRAASAASAHTTSTRVGGARAASSSAGPGPSAKLGRVQKTRTSASADMHVTRMQAAGSRVKVVRK